MRTVYQSGFSDRNILAFRSLLRKWSDDFAKKLILDGGRGSKAVDIQDRVQQLAFRVVGLFPLGVDFEDEAFVTALDRTMKGSSWSCSNYGQLWFRLLEHTQMRIVF